MALQAWLEADVAVKLAVEQIKDNANESQPARLP
jgi:hypothetical protein